MKTILLYGHLGKAFGRVHRFDIGTPAEAIRALRANFNGFEAHLLRYSSPGYRVLVGGESRTLEQIAQPSGERETIRIVPLVSGAGKGLGGIILGAALIGVGIATGGASLTLSSAWAGGFATTAGYFATSIGVSLVLGGISQMLFQPPKPSGSIDRPDNKPSFAFDGAVNTVAQGNPAPVCYGRMVVGSQVIYAGLGVEQIDAQGNVL